MMVRRMLAHLETSRSTELLPAVDRKAVTERYAEVHSLIGAACSTSITPFGCRHAIENTRNLRWQPVLACRLPGNNEL